MLALAPTTHSDFYDDEWYKMNLEIYVIRLYIINVAHKELTASYYGD